MRDLRQRGRHRLGTPGLVYCGQHPSVAAALEVARRTWLAGIILPARHSMAGLRRRAALAATERAWAPLVRAA
ncbi:hypothetical protein [Actinokineospora enzanensis]|uniref:hypothetical protein n=1 Tax=Actinokineospora enzanensis TaxID=155975 RepID=UPI00036D84C7|nr:hypothetical protein [Actinokineospora enzanensis]